MPKNFLGGPLFFGKVLVSKKTWITSYHHFVELFCLTSPKINVGEPVCVSEIFWFQNFSDISGVLLLSSVFVSQCWKICGEPSNDLKKFTAPKNFMQNRCVSRFSVENFLSHSTEKLREGPLSFGNLLVSKKFWIISCHDFAGIFCLTVPKFFWGFIDWYKKAIQKIYAWKRSSKIFPGKSLVSQYRKTSCGTLLCSKNFLVRKKFMDKKGGVKFFRRSFFVPSRRKHRGRAFLCFRNVLVSKVFR